MRRGGERGGEKQGEKEALGYSSTKGGFWEGAEACLLPAGQFEAGLSVGLR